MDNPAARVVGALSRRVRTLIVSGILFLVLLILTLTLPVPYVILTPGLTCNTLGPQTDCGGSSAPVIAIQGITPKKTSGNLNLTTVYVTGPEQNLTVFDALSAWLQNDQVVVPRSSIYPPGESNAEVEQQNTQEFVASQSSAVLAAACELGWRPAFGIVEFPKGSPSAGKLHVGDAIVSVAGQPADNIDKLRAVLATQQPGTTVPVVVTHATQSAQPGPQETVNVTLGKPYKGAKGASLGIAPSNGQVCLTPYTVTIDLERIGGPSAGLMFALGILDKVGPTDLTDGRFIAGTGTIDDSGKVGAIGGIQLKMIAARDKGASVFLAPADNCGDVRGAIPSGLQIVKVSTLHEAVQDLELLDKDKPVPSC